MNAGDGSHVEANHHHVARATSASSDDDDRKMPAKDNNKQSDTKDEDGMQAEHPLNVQGQPTKRELQPEILRYDPLDNHVDPLKNCLTCFLDVANRLTKIWPIGICDQQVVLNAVFILEKTPFLAVSLKRLLDDAKMIIGRSDSPSQVELPPDVLRKLAECPDEKERDVLTVKQIFIKVRKAANKERKEANKERKERELSLVHSKMFRTLLLVTKKTDEVRYQLVALSGLSRSRVEESETESSEDSESEGMGNDWPAERGFRVLEPSALYSSVIKQCKNIEKVLPGLSRYPLLSDKKAQLATQKLQLVAKCFKEHLSEATFLADDDEAYKGMVVEAMKCLRDTICIETSAAPCQHGQSSEETSAHDTTAGPHSTKYAPGARADKVDGTRPYVKLLVQAIRECWDPSAASMPSPTKSSVCENETIPKTAKRLKRTIDCLPQKEGRWDSVVFDDKMIVPVQVRPGCRKRIGPAALLDEARDSVLACLARYLYTGLNFAAFGAPCHCTGIIANMAAVQIIQLRYENVGTPNAKLALYQSDLLPLMSIENFKRWAMSAMTSINMKKQFDAFEKHLYGPVGKDGMDEAGIPKGVQLLFTLLNQPSTKLNGLSVDGESAVLGDHIGTGQGTAAFRRVGADGEKLNSVIKLSSYSYEGNSNIDNELKILKVLATAGQGSWQRHLSSMVDSTVVQDGKLRIKLGSVLTELPALEVTPMGKKASLVFSSAVKCVDDDLRLVFDGITSALEHMHSLEVCHCDVSPNNIIFASDRAGTNRRAVLIDFSFSRNWSASLKGFHGTPLYAHREIFLCRLHYPKRWKPRPEHDKAGMGFTLAFLANRCADPWDVGDYPQTMDKPEREDVDDLEAVMKTRLENAKASVVDCVLNDDIDRLLECDHL